ncbi:Hippocampus abundant transcript 1 protein [Phytophthora boehmeriae]|uniref:Hippocampus abundant transcript 1 protein n=1 Tax=Phytophthora boehmeriae TaxID=109152 RepID=A0A8T1WQ03_9STRA|nr:Hippocampus abundant transcript 1 protein [Phytophthora boehmeriae]
MERTSIDPTLPKPLRKRSWHFQVGAIIGLQFLVAAAFGVMSPILSILMTEVLACVAGSREAAWVSSIFSAIGGVGNFILAPMLGQASDVYGRKPFLVLSQVVRVATPFTVMYFMQPEGSIVPYFILRLVDSGFGTAGVTSAAVADVVPPEDRAVAFGITFASLSVGYCIKTLPMRAQANKPLWVVENPISLMSILFRNQLFMRLTLLIALTTFVMSGTFQIQTFFLNTIVGFDVKDFGNLMLLGGIGALVSQGLLLKPLLSCMDEKGVIVLALVTNVVTSCGFVASAYHPHKWLIYAMTVPGCISDLSFPAISALKSNNVSEKEQGRLQGALYGARSAFDSIGPLLFATLYAAMTRESVWSQALPYVVAAVVYFIGIGVALSLPAGKVPVPGKNVTPTPLLSPTYGEAPSAASMYFETDDDDESMEEGGESDGVTYAKGLAEDDNFLAEPLLGGRSTTEHV